MSLLDFFSGGNNDAADRATRDALNQYSTIVAPSLEELQVQYEELKNAGLLTPELEQVFQQQASEMQNVATDPRLKQAQLNALSSLEDIGQNGMTLQDKANLQKIQTQLGQQERGAREAILQNAARRGTAGSGFELAAQLSNNQAVQDRMSQEGLDVAAQAQSRALQALIQGGQLGGQIRSQDFSEQAEKAQAQDAINRFNTANRQQVMGQNIDRRNNAQASNLQNAQDIMNKNVGIRNQQQDRNVGARQQVYDNQMGLANARSGAYQNQADQYNRRGQAETDFWGNIINTGARVGAAYLSGGASELTPKKK